MDKTLVKTSKFLSLVLRHEPEAIGLKLDEQGWADVQDLIDRMRQKNHAIDLAVLTKVVESNDKQRFSFNDDRTRIRANQGHSIEIDLALNPLKPPDVLYHGTAIRFLEAIRQKGLVKGARRHVHLSADEQTASKVGQRHGKPVVLVVRSGAMHSAAIQFFRAANGVWLTEHVPNGYINFPDADDGVRRE
jgi:putative RNA 2'-phosphotransferase